eukprot:1138248-Pelagomonas_calceolata.AAC.6
MAPHLPALHHVQLAVSRFDWKPSFPLSDWFGFRHPFNLSCPCRFHYAVAVRPLPRIYLNIIMRAGLTRFMWGRTLMPVTASAQRPLNSLLIQALKHHSSPSQACSGKGSPKSPRKKVYKHPRKVPSALCQCAHIVA